MRQTVKVVSGGALYSYKEVVCIRSIADQDVNPSPNGTRVAVLEFWKKGTRKIEKRELRKGKSKQMK